MTLESIRKILKKPVAKIGTAFATGLLAYNLSTTDIRADSSQLEIPVAAVAAAMVGYGLFARDSETNKNFEIRPYLKLGSVKWEENGISEGHKFIATPGVSVSSLKGKVRFRGSLEACVGGEPSDEDIEVPNQDIYHLNANVTFQSIKDDSFYFILGANLDRLERDRNEKYPNSFKRMDYVTPEAGLGVRYKKIGAEIKVNHPLWVNTDVGNLKGKLGIEASASFSPNNRLTFEAFYKDNSFKGNENQPESSIKLTGVKVGLRF